MILNPVGISVGHLLQALIATLDLTTTTDNLLHLHTICPVGFTLENQEMQVLRVLGSFFGSNLLLDELFLALSELE
jgi:hypothetical protein